MTDKKPTAKNDKAAKNNSKKSASGKVTKPLRRASVAKSGQQAAKLTIKRPITAKLSYLAA